jgi:hypothetical protein
MRVLIAIKPTVIVSGAIVQLKQPNVIGHYRGIIEIKPTVIA